MTLRDRAAALLDSLESRREITRAAPALDADAELRRAVWEEGRRRGAELDEAALRWPAKRLLRVARGRAGAAQVRRNPIAVDEGFSCGHCGRDVPPHGRTARNHCPWCLRSRHVDEVPGDRAAECGGLMDPVRMEIEGGSPALWHRCRSCGAERRVRVLTDGEVPDDWAAVVQVSAGTPP